jgi:hypothetical protein
MRARTGAREVRFIFHRRRHAVADGAGDRRRGAGRGCANWNACRKASRSRWRPTPSSVEADRFRGYRAAGVNRVSLGVQALNDADLRFLGRLHDVEQALARAIGLAREIFPRLSFDLIYARPRPDRRCLDG